MTAPEVETTILRAAWVAPMDGPPIPDAAVVFRAGIITDVGSANAVRRRNGGAVVRDLGDAIITPGLINAHTHLELSDMTPGAPPASFADWLISLMRRLTAARFDSSDAPSRGAQTGIEQSLRFGVTTVADVTSCPGATRPVLRASPLRAISFGEIRAMASRRTLLEPQLEAAADRSWATERATPGLSPHAPYSIEPDGYRRCLARAAREKLRLTTHLAETPDEATFLHNHDGPFARVWAFRGGWDDAVPTFDGGPIRFAKSLGLLDAPTLLAHVNYCDDAEVELLAAGQASVAYCPRTHAYFGHPPHRWRDMLSRGINVCVGTDSCASSPDLNVLDDLRLLRHIAPDLPASAVWQMATSRAAAAMGLANEVGTVSVGKRADLIAFRLACDDPLAELLDSSALPEACWVDGRAIYAQGTVVHPAIQYGGD